MLTSILFISVCFLAYANGANDNFKGVASLFGSGTANFRQTLTYLISVIRNVAFGNYPNPFIIHKMLIIRFIKSSVEVPFLTAKQKKAYVRLI
jgi:hypothetical protein